MMTPGPIESDQGYTKQIGFYVSTMKLVRQRTLSVIKDLTQQQLDYKVGPHSNRIGTLLLHIASFEVQFQAVYLQKRPLTRKEYLFWSPFFSGNLIHATELGEGIDYYKNILKRIRGKTLKLLALKNDRWFIKYKPIRNSPINMYYLYFHMLEDEINHLGQIKLMKKEMYIRGIK